MASGVLKSNTEGKVVKLFTKKQQKEAGETMDLEQATTPAPVSEQVGALNKTVVCYTYRYLKPTALSYPRLVSYL